MTEENGGRGLLRFWPYAVVTTTLVAGCPVIAVYALETAGVVRSTVLSVALGALLSAGVATLGSALWARLPGPRDMVFGDLMLWGFLRRLRSEKSISEIIELLDHPASEPDNRSHIDPPRRIDMLKKLAAALEARDPQTHGHTHRVARHSYMVARAMRLPPAQIDRIRTAAAVHDVGKIYVPQEILHKPGKLTSDELAVVREHAAMGSAMVARAEDSELTALVRHHHERIDGRGYPDGLAGDDIPLGARIIAVADTFDAITSTRTYRRARPHERALETLKAEANTQLDGDVVDAFLAYYSGRSSCMWWASLTTAAQRLLARLVEWLPRGPAGVTNTMAAVGVAGAVSAPLSPPPAPPPERVPAVTATPAVELMEPTRPAMRHNHFEDPEREEHRQRRPPPPSSAADHLSGATRRGPVGAGTRGPGDSGSSGPSGGDRGDAAAGGADTVQDVVEALPDPNHVGNESMDTVHDRVDGLVDLTDDVTHTLDGALSLPRREEWNM